MTLEHHNSQVAADLRHAANILEAYPEIPKISDVTLSHGIFPHSDEARETAKSTVIKFVRAMKHKFKVEKSYYGNYFSAKAKINKSVTVGVATNRETVCRVVNTTKKYVPPMEGYYKEEKEWDCEPILKDNT